MSADRFTLATAPVSFGIFGRAARALTAAQILDAFVAAGFTAIELGPPGLFGSPAATAAAVRQRDLAAVGAYVPFHFTADEAVFTAEVAAYDRTLDELAACATPGARAILADEGSPELRRMPGRPDGHPASWSPGEWERAAARIEAMADRARHRGLVASFHPHLTTYVENGTDLAQLLERTSIGLTVDTGHFLLGGTDPAAFVRQHGDRVNHLHVKDVSRAALPAPEFAATCDVDDWFGDVGVPLGTGDVDLADFVAAVADLTDAAPWIVIEQDRREVAPAALADVVAGEAGNRQVMTELLAGRR